MDLGLDPQSVGGVHQDAEQPDGAARLPLAGPANHHVAQAAIGADEARLDLEIASIRDRGSHRRLDRRRSSGVKRSEKDGCSAGAAAGSSPAMPSRLSE